MSFELAIALSASTALLGNSPSNSSNPSTNLETVLKSRLSAYYCCLNKTADRVSDSSSVQDLRFLTAIEAASLLERIQDILEGEGRSSEDGSGVVKNNGSTPLIGTRDLAKIRTLLSITFKWGIEPLLAFVSRAWPTSFQTEEESTKLLESLNSKDYFSLIDLLISVKALIFPQGIDGPLSHTLIASTLLSRHVSDLLRPSIAIGWLPVSTQTATKSSGDQQFVLRLLKFLSPAQAISSLGSILSSTAPAPPLFVRNTCASLLSKQLLRQDGVHGLFEALFPEDLGGGDLKSERLEHIAKTLNTPPMNVKPEDYYPTIYSQVVNILSNEKRDSYIRGAAFVIYRAIVPKRGPPRKNHASHTMLGILQDSFLKDLEDRPKFSAKETLSTLTALLLNTEPSPIFISRVLSPIIPSLYVLSSDLHHIKVVDPQLKELVKGLLVSWGKIVDPVEGCNILWSVIEGGKAWEWNYDIEGEIRKSKPEKHEEAPILMPGNLKESEHHSDEDFNIDENLFNLYPEPIHFVTYLKALDRGDIVSSLFLKLLESYRDMKTRSGDDSMKILNKLQIIMQMQKQLSEGTTSNILRKPDLLFSFILNVMESALNNKSQADDEHSLEGYDSDDEDEGSETIGPDDDLVETAITLLLSILEGDETLSVETHPILNSIYVKLEPFAHREKGSSSIQPLAREARLVVTARLAGKFATKTSNTHRTEEEDGQEIYQKALKLLQDPILPVRAHGLLLLRELVSRKNHQVNKAFAPSVLSIFLQTVHDDDSYMFLNAVQGLAGLVDSYGKDILQSLVHDYAGGLNGLGAGNLKQHDMDVRTRIGEALSSVIKRCGQTLGVYVDIIVPPIIGIIRNSDVPTALRTSSFSLLADCVDTYALAMLPYVEDLCQGIVDLLQVESIAFREKEGRQQKPSGEAGDEVDSVKTPSMDSDPTSRNSKFPPLRRAALHFLSLLIRSSTKFIYESQSSGGGSDTTSMFPAFLVEKLRITLGYVSVTDEDNVVRVMAREAREGLDVMQRAKYGV